MREYVDRIGLNLFLVSFQERGHDMFIYWMGTCNSVDQTIERQIVYDKSKNVGLNFHNHDLFDFFSLIHLFRYA
jgi:hypothetical protein